MSPTNAVLIVAHPGHELLLHHWLEQVRPRVYALTDGSGADQAARTAGARAVLTAAGAEAGDVFGQASDRAWYRALTDRDPSPLLEAAGAILADARRLRPALIVSDAVEGYNPMHDLAAGLAEAVCAALAAEGAAVEHLVYPTVGDAPLGVVRSLTRLDEAAVERKLAAARAQPALRTELEAYLERVGAGVACEELFRPGPAPAPDWRPRYEELGRRRVASGRYSEAIESRRHVLPMLDALRAWSIGVAAADDDRLDPIPPARAGGRWS